VAISLVFSTVSACVFPDAPSNIWWVKSAFKFRLLLYRAKGKSSAEVALNQIAQG
jgi:hypothetical protein